MKGYLADCWLLAARVELIMLRTVVVATLIVARVWCVLYLLSCCCAGARRLYAALFDRQKAPPQEKLFSDAIQGAGPPSDDLGRINQFYFDEQNTLYYGPKLASGWGRPHAPEATETESIEEWRAHMRKGQRLRN